MKRQLIEPTLSITLQEFRDFIHFYQARGYQFVAPDDVVSGLPLYGKYVLITFDDGYFNNRRVLPVLQELQVPAVFSIATAYVESGKSFWWDVLYHGHPVPELVLLFGSVAMGIVILVWLAMPSQSGENRFGPEPPP